MVPQPLPNLRDLVAAHELFTNSRRDVEYNKFEFVQCINERPDIALLGRINVGKTTLLTRIARNQKLKVEKVPPTTQKVIPYKFGPQLITRRAPGRIRLLDLPGYGHKSTGQQAEMVGKSVFKRKLVRGAIMLVNAPHGLKDHDLMMLEQIAYREMPFVVVLNKAEYLVPRQDERDFPAHLWQHLISEAKRIHDTSGGLGAGPYLRGIFVAGGGKRVFGSKSIGLLGVKYAIARMAGLVGEDDWGKPRDVKAFESLGGEEAPLTSEFDASEAKVFNYSISSTTTPGPEGSEKPRPEDSQRAEAEWLAMQEAVEEQHGVRSGRRRKPAKNSRVAEEEMVSGQDRGKYFRNLTSREDVLAHYAKHGTPREQRKAMKKAERKKKKTALKKAMAEKAQRARKATNRSQLRRVKPGSRDG